MKFGPTSNIKYYNSNIMVGFHRLAIIGISGEAGESSEAMIHPRYDGMQPFELGFTNQISNTITNRFVLVCNGEIYNHRELQSKYKFPLKSHSDCEVILHLFNHIVGKNVVEFKHLELLVDQLD